VDQDRHSTGQKKRLPSWLGTLGVVLIYAALLASTDNRFTMLDDESDSNAIAGRPMARAQQPFRFATDIASFIRLKLKSSGLSGCLRRTSPFFYCDCRPICPSSVSFSLQQKLALGDALRRRCAVPGELRAAPDPAIAWKQQFTNDVPMLAYRTDATWLD